MPGIYISYPFCNQKCTFCNFASGVSSPAARRDYERNLIAELQAHPWQWMPETVYFGGGTPSLMDQETLKALLAPIPRNSLKEITMECAPGTLTRERARLWVDNGVNRVSLGVQSFNVQELRATGRRHSADTVASNIALLREFGIDNFNIDLIAGLPCQTKDSWSDSLDWIARLDPPHVSIYIFEVDEDSRLGKELISGGPRYSTDKVPSEELTADFYETAVSRLNTIGIERYEISNFAKPGYASRHNLKYWKLEPYIGFGLDAHSFDGTVRWSTEDGERTVVDHGEEHFFVGLRLSEGIRPSVAEWQRFAQPIRKWMAAGMLVETGERLRLSPRGVLLSNEIFQEFIHV